MIRKKQTIFLLFFLCFLFGCSLFRFKEDNEKPTVVFISPASFQTMACPTLGTETQDINSLSLTPVNLSNPQIIQVSASDNDKIVMLGIIIYSENNNSNSGIPLPLVYHTVYNTETLTYSWDTSSLASNTNYILMAAARDKSGNETCIQGVVHKP